jgi:hypothetical protein
METAPIQATSPARSGFVPCRGTAYGTDATRVPPSPSSVAKVSRVQKKVGRASIAFRDHALSPHSFPRSTILRRRDQCRVCRHLRPLRSVHSHSTVTADFIPTLMPMRGELYAQILIRTSNLEMSLKPRDRQ